MRIDPTQIRRAAADLGGASSASGAALGTTFHWYTRPSVVRDVGDRLLLAGDQAAEAASLLTRLDLPELAVRATDLSTRLRDGGDAARAGNRNLGALPQLANIQQELSALRSDQLRAVGEVQPDQLRDWLQLQAGAARDESSAMATLAGVRQLVELQPKFATTVARAVEVLLPEGLTPDLLYSRDGSIEAMRALASLTPVPEQEIPERITTIVRKLATTSAPDRLQLVQLHAMLGSPAGNALRREHPALDAIGTVVARGFDGRSDGQELVRAVGFPAHRLAQVHVRSVQLLDHVMSGGAPLDLREGLDYLATSEQSRTELGALGILPAQYRPAWIDGAYVQAVQQDAIDMINHIRWPTPLDRIGEVFEGVRAARLHGSSEAVGKRLDALVEEIHAAGGYDRASVEQLRELRGLIAVPQSLRLEDVPRVSGYSTAVAIDRAAAGYRMLTHPTVWSGFDELDRWHAARTITSREQAVTRARALLDVPVAARTSGMDLELRSILTQRGAIAPIGMPPLQTVQMTDSHDLRYVPGAPGWNGPDVLRAQLDAQLDPDVARAVVDDARRATTEGPPLGVDAVRSLARARVVDVHALARDDRLTVATMRSRLAQQLQQTRSVDIAELRIATAAAAGSDPHAVPGAIASARAAADEMVTAASGDQSAMGGDRAPRQLLRTWDGAVEVAARLAAVRPAVEQQAPALLPMLDAAQRRAATIVTSASDMRDLIEQGASVRELEQAWANPDRAELARLRVDVEMLGSSWPAFADAATDAHVAGMGTI